MRETAQNDFETAYSSSETDPMCLNVVYYAWSECQPFAHDPFRPKSSRLCPFAPAPAEMSLGLPLPLPLPIPGVALPTCPRSATAVLGVLHADPVAGAEAAAALRSSSIKSRAKCQSSCSACADDATCFWQRGQIMVSCFVEGGGEEARAGEWG